MKTKRTGGAAALIAAAALLLAGCGSTDTYYWGHYEDTVYVAYADPGSVPLAEQVRILQTDAEKAQAKGKPLPPGFHAQLGYLYYQEGKADLARQEFTAEKRLFPESTKLMDRLLAKLGESVKP
jgi:hypothetical protein